MTTHNTDLTSYEQLSLDRIVRNAEIVLHIAEFTKAIRIIAEFVWDVGKLLVPTVVGYSIEAIGNIVETVVVRYAEVRSRIERAQIRQISNDFIKATAESSLYAEPIARSMKEAASRKFLKSMEPYGVVGVSLEELMNL